MIKPSYTNEARFIKCFLFYTGTSFGGGGKKKRGEKESEKRKKKERGEKEREMKGRKLKISCYNYNELLHTNSQIHYIYI